MAITKEIPDELLKDYQQPEDLLGQSRLLQQLSKALIERVLDSELRPHPGYQQHAAEGWRSGNSRNGKSRKVLKGKPGEIPIQVPRDRQGEFEPQFIKIRPGLTALTRSSFRSTRVA
jgi:putative transposase